VAVGDELFRDFLVAREPLHLEHRALVPVDAEPFQAVEDRVDRLLRRALEIGVFDAKDESATVVASVRPGKQRRARAADVQEAGGARREAGTDFQSVPPSTAKR